jgi:hypothetical protein
MDGILGTDLTWHRRGHTRSALFSSDAWQVTLTYLQLPDSESVQVCSLVISFNCFLAYVNEID